MAHRLTLVALQRLRVANIAVPGRLHPIAERVEGVVLLVEDEGADVRVLRASVTSAPVSAPVSLTSRRAH